MSRSSWNPTHRFRSTEIVWDEPPPPPKLQLIDDASRSILARNDSPDIPYTWSVNPYRGCTHACAYCYARAFHEYLDLGAGTDFERILHVKHRAPELLAEAFAKRSWAGEGLAFSGVTDCYQPIERRLTVTRRCLEVCAAHRNPVGVITRSPLVTRDIDLLEPLARLGAAHVSLSIPILDPELCRMLEPGAPPPSARLAAVRALADAGIPVGVSLGPLIPGINDAAMPETLAAAREAGAQWAFTMLVRLAPSVARVFERRLRETLPLRAGAVMARLRRARDGKLNEGRFGHRMVGQGEAWEMTMQMFRVHRDRLGFTAPRGREGPSPFRRPGEAVQLSMFPNTRPAPGARER
ncbi:MAG: radical SAM protein [Alphaproteobacteria bacterium]|nr:radical SAM protein [Alphaproteobacteria bacterium]